MTFQLDTSGRVRKGVIRNGAFHFRPGFIRWTDLTPFAQGYTAPILEAAGAAFWQLAPATLGRILEDCERALGLYGHQFSIHRSALDGQAFWAQRQAGGYPKTFPPLVVSLSDDGLVYLTEGVK